MQPKLEVVHYITQQHYKYESNKKKVLEMFLLSQTTVFNEQNKIK